MLVKYAEMCRGLGMEGGKRERERVRERWWRWKGGGMG